MTLNGSMDSQAFAVFVEQCLVPNLGKSAVVVMDNLPAHKLAVIEPFDSSGWCHCPKFITLFSGF
ncbi:hypothetical protein E5S67_06313 [Microcoleus sp. IPMA8]|uniref:Tc1-like transposase DDE domain-containing protein n=2 Tax=Microcoleus TaxID=44471 RepID=A0ABX2D7H9_9CYAN|nr:hypothetical protein [Microcoleus asticus IPMA8]